MGSKSWSISNLQTNYALFIEITMFFLNKKTTLELGPRNPKLSRPCRIAWEPWKTWTWPCRLNLTTPSRCWDALGDPWGVPMGDPWGSSQVVMFSMGNVTFFFGVPCHSLGNTHIPSDNIQNYERLSFFCWGINYFYGHVQWQTVSLPEGNLLTLILQSPRF